MRAVSPSAPLARPYHGVRSLVGATKHSGVVAAVATIVPVVVFAPTLWHGFVWDDEYNIVHNFGYRGLGWAQLTWMFGTAHLAHWTPITWLTLGFDYVVWGMNACGYHLSNVVLHAVNAWLLYLIAARLLSAARLSSATRPISSGALAAALFFSIHPLRAESVSWITERRDLVAGCFFLLTILTYLNAHRARNRSAVRWRLGSIICFELAVLSKATVVGLPVVLLVLDVYPLRRLTGRPTQWLTAPNRSVVAEKAPYVALAILGSGVTAAIFGSRSYLSTLDAIPLLTRPAVVAYGVSFYLWKTVLPFGLSPLYEMPLAVNVLTLEFLAPLIATSVITVLVVALRHRWPSGLSAWISYLVILAPVSGILHQGAHLVADRNTYLACLPFALLYGGGVAILANRGIVGATRRPALRFAPVFVTALLLMFAVSSWRQALIWRDTETLWQHAVAVDPGCYRCQHNLGLALVREGRVTSGIEHIELAAALRPWQAAPQGALVIAYLGAGQREKAGDRLRVLKSIDGELARDLSALFVTTW